MTLSLYQCRSFGRHLAIVLCIAIAKPLFAQTPIDPALLAALAADLFKQGQPKQALSLAEDGLRTNPRHLSLLTIAGVAARALGQHADATRHWETAKSIEPFNIYVTENLVLTYQIDGNKERRDRMRAELMKLREAVPDKKTLKPSYTRDDFRVGSSIVVCNEYYELEGPQPMRYLCSVFPSIREPAVSRIALVSPEDATQKARAMGLTGPAERFFQLAKADGGGIPQTYISFPREPSYDEVREQIVLILEGRKKPPTPVSTSAAAAADEGLISEFLATREALAQDPKVNVPEMSKLIRASLNEVESLLQKADYQGALKRLGQLETYRPLIDFPSFEVQLMLLAIYMKLGDSQKVAVHKARAQAMRELLSWRIGSGESVGNPKRVLMANEISEWVRLQGARVVDIKGRPYQGKELQEVSYSGPSTNNQPKVAYFEIDPRARAAQNRQLRLFEPYPVSTFGPRELAAFNTAREKRNRFLDERSFAYDVLMVKIRDTMKTSMELNAQGKSSEALAKLKELEAIRPIEDIPLVDLLSLYSLLNGRVGNTTKQIEIRTLLFGINQAIAHSGDGLSPETAVEVVAVPEEYAWLSDKGLTRVRQRILDTPSGKFDVLTAKDAAGNERDYYFNITRIFPRGVESIVQPPATR